MPHPNRVQPDGSFVATAARGGFMGNRGRLHDAGGVICRRWQGKAWITCTLHEKPGRASPGVLPVRGYTRLFFQDEAVACAAGHRPCAECRRAAYRAFRAAWAQAFGSCPDAKGMDALLHTARIDAASRQPRRNHALAETLPAGVFILLDGAPHRLTADAALPHAPGGYGPARPRPRGHVTVLTPAPLVAVMAAGWQPVLAPADDKPNW